MSETADCMILFSDSNGNGGVRRKPIGKEVESIFRVLGEHQDLALDLFSSVAASLVLDIVLKKVFICKMMRKMQQFENENFAFLTW